MQTERLSAFIFSVMIIRNLLFSVSCSFSQEVYYYDGDRKVALIPDYYKYSMEFDSTMTESQIDSLLESAGFRVINKFGVSRIWFIEIAGLSTNAINILKNSEKVLYLRNGYLRNRGIVFLLNKIVVQFRSWAPDPDIESVISQYRLQILGGSFISKYFEFRQLSSDKENTEIDIANALHDMPIVEYANPGLTIPFITEYFGPEEYRLYPAYPNPFNASTTIRFNLSRWGGVARVAIYNILGQQVEVLRDGRHYFDGGWYVRVWDASRFASGIYFVHMEAKNDRQNYRKTMKITLIR